MFSTKCLGKRAMSCKKVFVAAEQLAVPGPKAASTTTLTAPPLYPCPLAAAQSGGSSHNQQSTYAFCFARGFATWRARRSSAAQHTNKSRGKCAPRQGADA